MEAFSLLKYWRAGGGTAPPDSIRKEKATTKSIVADATVSPYSSDGEDGPYFDLEFSPPDQQNSAESQENDIKHLQTEDQYETESGEISLHENEEAEIEFSLSSNDCVDQNAAHSPSDDLYFRGNSVSIEPSCILLNNAEENSKFPIFLVKSATKFRVFLLKLKKPKSVNAETAETRPPKTVERENAGKYFVKFKVEEGPLVNLFARDNSWKENHVKGPKQNVEDSVPSSVAEEEERKLPKEVVHKYLKMVKPLYIRVSKLKFSGRASNTPTGNVKSSQHKEANNLQAGLKVVLKHLGKSRSASSSAADPPPKMVSDRRDDSLLQLQDGIQNAILHCKTSYNASRDVESSSSTLCRSASDPSYEKSAMMPKFSIVSGEAKKLD